jgi:hypothetical protein
MQCKAVFRKMHALFPVPELISILNNLSHLIPSFTDQNENSPEAEYNNELVSYLSPTIDG